MPDARLPHPGFFWGATMKPVVIDEPVGLEEYGQQPYLSEAVRNLRSVASSALPSLRERRIWIINSTAQGGGVAEILPKEVRLLRDAGLRVEWLVMETAHTEFFALTKRIHNMIHGVGDPRLGPEDRALYDFVSRETATSLRHFVSPGDLLYIHDPQPLGAGAILKTELGLPAVWRCHIGLDDETPTTAAAWEFLRPYVLDYDRAIFTSSEYVPQYAVKRSRIVPPGIDPASYKNTEISHITIVGILSNSGIHRAPEPVVRPPWEHRAMRLAPDGRFLPAVEMEDLGLGYRPMVLQVSRWDQLKGWLPLLKGFVKLKTAALIEDASRDPLQRRRLQLLRLVLAGPDPSSVQDDPEGSRVLEELRAEYLTLPSHLRSDVAILVLPMASRKENALMVNVLQRCASVVVQNSLQEGFGLTATEAMWKRAPVLGTRACGLRIQIRDGLEGRINTEPENPDAVAAHLEAMLRSRLARERWGAAAQRRVYDEFLLLTEVRRILEVLSDTVQHAERLRRRHARTELRKKAGPEAA
jgi:trehalose synthase